MESKIQKIENQMITAMLNVPQDERMEIFWAAADQAYFIYLQYGVSEKVAKDTAFWRMNDCRWKKHHIWIG